MLATLVNDWRTTFALGQKLMAAEDLVELLEVVEEFRILLLLGCCCCLLRGGSPVLGGGGGDWDSGANTSSSESRSESSLDTEHLQMRLNMTP